MHKSVVIAILIDGDHPNVCFAGRQIEGHVVVNNSEKIKIRGIHLEVTGKAYTHWKEASDKVQYIANDDTTHYFGVQRFLALSFDVIGSKDNDRTMYIQPGCHRFPFQCLIPDNVPSSFEDAVGQVRYKMKAVIGRPWKIDDKATIQLTVIRLFDLNRESWHLWMPLDIHCLQPATGYYASGLVEFKATVNKGCFVATEKIIVSGSVTNKTNAPVTHTTISFVQDKEYKAKCTRKKTYTTKHSRHVLAKVSRPGIRTGCADSWNDVEFVVPPLPPSRLDGCSLINITYGIQIAAVFSTRKCDSSATTVFVPIVIGHVALRNDFQSSLLTSQPPPPYSITNQVDADFPPDVVVC